jgi:hypothetical protein
MKMAEQLKGWATGDDLHDSNATMTAQYVRLAMFVMVVVLGGAIIWATSRDGGAWEGSISDYFHTPAQLALVGTMVTIGICLMALYSSNALENFLLNAAGIFAPIVGFAATTQSTGAKAPFDFDVPTSDVDQFARASLIAYFAALVLLACLVAVVHPRGTRLKKSGLTMLAVAALAGATWAMWEWDRRKIHVVAAIGFFLPLIVLIFVKAMMRGASARLRTTYISIGLAMVVAAIWYFIDRKTSQWDYATLFVEVTLIVCFAVFWLIEYIRIAPRSHELVAADAAS